MVPKSSHASVGVGEQVKCRNAGMMRTMRHSLEKKLGRVIDVWDPRSIMGWSGAPPSVTIGYPRAATAGPTLQGDRRRLRRPHTRVRRGRLGAPRHPGPRLHAERLRCPCGQQSRGINGEEREQQVRIRSRRPSTTNRRCHLAKGPNIFHSQGRRRRSPEERRLGTNDCFGREHRAAQIRHAQGAGDARRGGHRRRRRPLTSRRSHGLPLTRADLPVGQSFVGYFGAVGAPESAPSEKASPSSSKLSNEFVEASATAQIGSLAVRRKGSRHTAEDKHVGSSVVSQRWRQ